MCAFHYHTSKRCAERGELAAEHHLLTLRLVTSPDHVVTSSIVSRTHTSNHRKDVSPRYLGFSAVIFMLSKFQRTIAKFKHSLYICVKICKYICVCVCKYTNIKPSNQTKCLEKVKIFCKKFGKRLLINE